MSSVVANCHAGRSLTHYLLTVQDKGRDLVHKGAKVYFNIRTIPTVASTVCINKVSTFRKRERERGKFKKGGKQKDTARETHLVGST